MFMSQLLMSKQLFLRSMITNTWTRMLHTTIITIYKMRRKKITITITLTRRAPVSMLISKLLCTRIHLFRILSILRKKFTMLR